MSDHDQPVAADLLDRKFEAERPEQRWVGVSRWSSRTRAWRQRMGLEQLQAEDGGGTVRELLTWRLETFSISR